MYSNLFNEIDDNKKSKIINVSIVEFAQFGFANSSTNRIVKEAGISKGSLFQYFKNKEDLYFFILDYAIEKLVSDLEVRSKNLSSDLFERIVDYSKLEFEWYIENPNAYKVIVNAFTKKNTDISRKVEAKYSNTGESIYHKLIEETYMKELALDKKTIDLIKWFLKGFNAEFIYKVESQDTID
ncbi:MAG: TetR/AcrR family transcriptional regulator, partial [Liquorilactobacillus satsumensis]